MTSSGAASPAVSDRANLAAIARKAMIARGLEPDFAPAARKEMASIAGPAEAADGMRDLRDRLWASIDNDDSRDLDQITVAETLPGGRVRILVAVARAQEASGTRMIRLFAVCCGLRSDGIASYCWQMGCERSFPPRRMRRRSRASSRSAWRRTPGSSPISPWPSSSSSGAASMRSDTLLVPLSEMQCG
jgi:hypothetical protein